ncbi:MAG: hypothetical protein U1C73_21625 [Dietzia sp.]|nr:hypothetical protein [Dietzia sp.]
MAWWGIAVMGAAQLAPLGERLPAVLGTVGRNPLRWYVLHVAVIAGCVALW